LSLAQISHAKAPRRKALPRFNGFLCVFAPLREKSASPSRTLVQSHINPHLTSPVARSLQSFVHLRTSKSYISVTNYGTQHGQNSSPREMIRISQHATTLRIQIAKLFRHSDPGTRLAPLTVSCSDQLNRAEEEPASNPKK